MNRRGFICALIGGFTLDPERLLWKPGAKLISIPAPSVSVYASIAAQLEYISPRLVALFNQSDLQWKRSIGLRRLVVNRPARIPIEGW